MNDSTPTVPPSSSAAAPETPPSVPAPTPLAEFGQAGGPRPFNEISVLFPLLTQYLHGTRLTDDERQTVREARQAEILEMIKAAGKVTKREVAARLQISARSASRLLGEMTAQGLIRQVGERKGTYFYPPAVGYSALSAIGGYGA